jgi:hypothetical protein
MPKSAKRFSENIMLHLLESITFYDFGSFSIQNHRDLVAAAPLIPVRQTHGRFLHMFQDRPRLKLCRRTG